MAYAAIIAAVIAAAASYSAERGAARRQDKIASQGIRNRGKRQREIDDKLDDVIKRTASSTPDGEKALAMQGFMRQLGATKGIAEAGLGPLSGGSDRYAADAKNAALGVAESGLHSADLLSRMDAPGYQRRREGIDAARAQGDIGAIISRTRGEDFINELRLRAVRKNPWLVALSQAAGSYAGGGGYGSSSSSGGGGMSSLFSSGTASSSIFG